MNTTNKYIYNLQTIDPISFIEKGTKELCIILKNIESDIKYILSTYTINKAGKITSIKSLDSGWTAYPPGTYEKSENLKREAIILETYNYENRRLVSIHKTNIKKLKEISIKQYRYENGFLKEELQENLKQIYTNDEQGRILQIDGIFKMPGDIKSGISVGFNLNELNQVSNKKTIFLNGLDSNMGNKIETNESYDYHPNGHLYKAKYRTINGSNKYSYLTFFDYLKNDQDLIESITCIGDESPSKSYRFEYNSKCLLQKSIAKDKNGSITETIYERTYYD